MSTNGSTFYALRRGRLVEVSPEEWLNWYLRSFNTRVVAETDIDPFYVLTFFLGCEGVLWVTHAINWQTCQTLRVVPSKTLGDAKRAHQEAVDRLNGRRR